MKKDVPLKIKFIPPLTNYEGTISPPEPAVKHVPEWYKSLARHDRSNSEDTLRPTNLSGSDGAQVHTKMCMPFFDALTGGYYVLLENDLHVDLGEDGRPVIFWDGHVLLADARPIVDIPVPDNCHPIHYGWRMHWYYETPPGYSVLVTHPMNRFDLPFYIMSGIVDSDIWGLPVFTTFFLKKGFRGVIPKGTPIMQFFPFKRDDWELEVDNSQETIDREEYKAEKRRTMAFGYYKKETWRKKFFGMIGRDNGKKN